MDLLADVRLGLRSLARRPGYAMLAILTLALGIGANTAAYSLVRSVLLRPLPYHEPDRLAMIWRGARGDGTTWLSAPELLSYGADVASVESIGAWVNSNANITGGGEPERVITTGVTPSLFRTLGAPPSLGSGFRDLQPGDPAPDEVVISHALWQRRYGGAADVVGRTVIVNGRATTVVGVMGPDFVLPVEFGESRASEMYLPLALQAQPFQGFGNRSFVTVARLRPGTTFDRATGEMRTVEDGWFRQGLITNRDNTGRAAVPIESFVLGEARRMLAIVLAAVAMILLIACANVANLTLARADERRRDTAVRTALGASRRRLVRELVTESALVAVAGATMGTLLATAAVRALVAANPTGIPRVADTRVDAAVLLATAALALATTLLFGLWPAVAASRVNLARAVADGGRTATGGRPGLRFRDALTVVQTAAAVILLVGATLLLRSLDQMARVNLGFRPDSVITARVSLPQATYAGGPEVIAFYGQLVPRLGAIPGASAAGAARLLPLTGTIGDWSITIEGKVRAPAENPNGDWQVATPGYFEAIGATLVKGRFLDVTDHADAPLVAVLSEAMAEKYWPGEEVLGKRFHLGTADQPWITVVGVVGPIRHNALTEAPRTEMYVPHAQWATAGGGAPRTMSVVVRGSRDTRTMAAALRSVVREMDANLPVSELQTLRDVTDRALARPRFVTLVLGAFAALALALAISGLYGVIALLVARRRQEIGVRIALGAQARSILMMVLRRGVALAGIGVAVGIVGAAWLTRLLQGMLYGVAVLDPLTYILVPAILLAVAATACLVPARRAAAVDPLVALRED